MLEPLKVHDLRKEDPEADATLVLVDRLWPRGVAKADFQPDEWLKNVAPSPDLRTWWNHDPDKFAEFSTRYQAELDSNDSDDMDTLQKLADAAFAEEAKVYLVYAARSREINHAVVLFEWLQDNGRG